MNTKTKSDIVADDVAALLRARNPLLWIVTREEARVERYLTEAAGAAGYVPFTWDVAQGVADMNGTIQQGVGSPDPAATLDTIRDYQNGRRVWILRDFHAWTGPQYATVVRQVRNLSRKLPTLPRDKAQAMIVLTPSATVPDELAGHATVIEWPLPDRQEIAARLDATLESLPDEIKATAAPNGQRDAAIDAAVGLSDEEAAACYAKSLVALRRIDPVMVANEKKRVIARERVLEWYDPLPNGLDAVGGLEGLKAWLLARKAAWSPKAREYGLPAPKGLLAVGIPGCGKSLTAKAIATAYACPLLRLDLGALKGKFVGESEGNLRKALRVIESVGKCVVWLDEIEKALAGATQGAADGGVSADALGSILSWMQDRTAPAFVFATANDVKALPPELLRKGRFDDVFYVDLPNDTEKAAILFATLRKHDRSKADVDVASVVDACREFTGSEIAELVPTAMFAAFADKAREITTDDLLQAAKDTVPLSRTAKAKIDAIREWGQANARPASLAEAPTKKRAAVRAVDLD